MSRAAAAKLSISVPDDLARTIRKRVGARGVSSFATRAMRHELEREREREELHAYVEELDAKIGPVPPALMSEARRAWKKR